MRAPWSTPTSPAQMVAACRSVSTPSPPASKPKMSTSRVVEEGREQPDRVGAAADAGGDGVGQRAGQLEALRAGLVADAAAEVADHRRERVRSGGRAEAVGGVVDAGHPVADRLVDGVLEGARARRHRDHLGAEQLHPRDVERLPLGVDLAHVDGAVEAEVRRRGGRGDAVLAGTGLGDHPGLAHPLGEQRLAEHVADLVGAGVVEVLALEQDPGTDPLAELGRVVEQARHAGVLVEHAVELVGEGRVGHRLLPGRGELVEGRHQRLGHEAATEVAEATGLVGSGAGRGHRGAPGTAFIAATAARGSPSLTRASPDEHHVGALAGVPGGVVGTGDAGLGHRHDVVGEQLGQPAERVGVDLERLEVAGVHADQLGADGEGALDLVLVVDLGRARSGRARVPGRAGRSSSASSRAATISSTRSAPAARASRSW